MDDTGIIVDEVGIIECDECPCDTPPECLSCEHCIDCAPLWINLRITGVVVNDPFFVEGDPCPCDTYNTDWKLQRYESAPGICNYALTKTLCDDYTISVDGRLHIIDGKLVFDASILSSIVYRRILSEDGSAVDCADALTAGLLTQIEANPFNGCRWTDATIEILEIGYEN